MSTFAGTGSAGTTDGHVGSATFSHPSGVAVDGSGNLYVTDCTGHRIRKIQGGFVSTLAGSGVAGYTNGVGTSASFNAPFGIAFNPVVWQFPLTGQFMWLIKVTTGFAVSAQRER